MLAFLGVLLGIIIAFFQPAKADVGGFLKLEKGIYVVKITGPEEYRTGGTGFELRAPSGKVYIVTNAHVCGVGKDGMVAVHSPRSERPYKQRIIEISDTTDLCLIEGLPGSRGLDTAPGLGIYEHLWVMGHPFLKPLTVTDGYIVSREYAEIDTPYTPEQCTGSNKQMKKREGVFGFQLDICVITVDSYDTSITAYPGNSGSPVFNSDGDVVGVVFATDGATARGLFIPLDVLQKFVAGY